MVESVDYCYGTPPCRLTAAAASYAHACSRTVGLVVVTVVNLFLAFGIACLKVPCSWFRILLWCFVTLVRSRARHPRKDWTPVSVEQTL
jgi:hypothetical protein